MRWTAAAVAVWILLWLVDRWRRRRDAGVRSVEDWRRERAARERAERRREGPVR